ncbi:MAG: type I-C CRISPR-associated protein Cas5c [Planctomycetes bacterium]|nr:type I-C CRISPR-associated protein Cas5c [Planctomycetota bacterium]
MDITKNRVSLRVWGDLACFTRPEMKVERVSYDVMTPSSARGILEAVFWKPEIRWVINRIRVLAPIRHTSVRRNELGGRGPSQRTLNSFMEGKKTDVLAQVIETDRQQRAATVLRNVDYLIEAHFEVLDHSQSPQKYYEIFKRRAQKGQCFHRPYLGCREFVADFAWYEGEPLPGHPSLRGEREFGWMLHDIEYGGDNVPKFYLARMNDGVIEVPPLTAAEVKS